MQSTIIITLLMTTLAYAILPVPCVNTPICASDGNTYSNLDEVNCLSVCRKQPSLKAIKIGKCIAPCICTKIYLPVCASNGITYDNPCLLECARRKDYRIQLIDNKPCDKVCFSKCRTNYEPVCGSNGATYFNIEFFNCAAKFDPNLTSTPGECRCNCPDIYKPVCGTDGITYANQCELDCEIFKGTTPGLSRVSDGVCPEKPCICPANWLPVCGSNGITYSNECSLNCAIKKTGSKLYKVNDGECIKIPRVTLPPPTIDE